MPLRPVQLGAYEDLEGLGRAAQKAINEVVAQLNRAESTRIIDAQNRRVAKVADPGEGGDAVNLRTLKKFINRQRGDITRVVNSITSGGASGSVNVHYVDVTLGTTGTWTATIPGAANDDDLVVYTIRRGTTIGQVVEWPVGPFAQSYYIGTETDCQDVYVFRKQNGPVMNIVSRGIINANFQ